MDQAVSTGAPDGEATIQTSPRVAGQRADRGVLARIGPFLPVSRSTWDSRSRGRLPSARPMLTPLRLLAGWSIALAMVLLIGLALPPPTTAPSGALLPD